MQAKVEPRYHDIVNTTIGVLFLGTPHRGFRLARFAKLHAFLLFMLGSDSSILEGLEYDSLALKDLQSTFFGAFNHLQLANVYEQRKTRLFKLAGIQFDSFVRLKYNFSKRN